ncbi:MAG TPA: PBP1A family penicillin-binding protein [Bryobacteraceae bacterium]|nr:PBP1A family penicillin-binding protein [Bryobacteraceae bacterium]
MKVRVPQRQGVARFLLGRGGRVLIVSLAVIMIVGLGAFTYFYYVYARVIDEKLRAGPFSNTAKLFGAPETVSVGDTITPTEIAAELHRSGYNESRSNPTGSYQMQANSISIFPGRDSYFEQEPGVVKFAGGKISQIISLQDNTPRSQYQLEPQLITAFSGPNREKRRMVKFRDIPEVLVQALTSAEDKRFFQHGGFDPFRIIKSFYVDIKEGRKDQGASTLTMQLARMFFLNTDKRWKRKLAEVMITLQLEQKLSKEEIFEDYANQIDLGWRGTFNIRGFGQAAEAYLGKDLSQITLPEAAELAGIPRSPANFDPFRHPDRLRERRNLVLSLMRANGFIGDRDYAVAIETPLTVAKGAAQSVEAPYFVDMVNELLQSKFQDENFQSNAFRVYTTLDLRLQRAAAEAVRVGMQNVDEQIRKQRRFKGQTPPDPQVALVALDPHTGAVKALVGGRSYGMSQLNHVLSHRQPGSIFKPFVYATAMETGVTGAAHILTPSTIVTDEPTTFWFDGRPYEPGDFEKTFRGDVTLREALAHSLNIPTVKVAEMVGYDRVVEMANRAGLNYKIHATPSVALGAYEVTPMEAAGAYTVFANQGTYVKPSLVTFVRSQDGKVPYKDKPEQKHVIDNRVVYIMTSLMEEVLRSGTAAGARAHYAFNVPAAGKTGTSSAERDGWFAGYTSELLCVVWVGFDDNRELDLEGARSAAPIWMEFMKRALDYREYRDTKPFVPPDGIISIDIDPLSGMPAGPNCPNPRPEVYIEGTEPVGSCPLHGGARPGTTIVTGWDTPSQERPAAQAPPAAGNTPLRITGSSGDGTVAPGTAKRLNRQDGGDPGASAQPQTPDQPDEEEKKGGFFSKIKGIFRKKK